MEESKTILRKISDVGRTAWFISGSATIPGSYVIFGRILPAVGGVHCEADCVNSVQHPHPRRMNGRIKRPVYLPILSTLSHEILAR